MPQENLDSILKPTKSITAENVDEKEQNLAAKSQDKGTDRHRAKESKKKPFTCHVAIFDKIEDPCKKVMYPKHLVYADGKDIQLEEIRAMRYWQKVKGSVPAICLDKPKTFRDMSTQTETAQATETSTQTECDSIQDEQIATEIKTRKLKKASDRKIPTSLPRIATRSSTRARLASKIPGVSNIAKNAIEEEPTILPSGSSETYIVSKDENQNPPSSKKSIRPNSLENLAIGERSDGDDEANDSILNTIHFKIVPSSTPFQADKNNNKERRKAIKIESPL